MSLAKGKFLLVRNCGQLLTLCGPARPRMGKEMGALGIIRRGALLIKNGLVANMRSEGHVSRLPEARGAVCLDTRLSGDTLLLRDESLRHGGEERACRVFKG